MEAAQGPVEVVDQHHRLVEDGDRDDVAGPEQVARVRDQLPGAADDGRLLPLEDAGIGVVGHGLGARGAMPGSIVGA